MGNSFLDSSILGNGRVGAAILGAIANERILINRNDLFWKGKIGVLQDVSDELPKMRKLFADGKIKETESCLSGALASKNCKLKHGEPMPMAVLNLDFLNFGAITNYERRTDMRTGEVTVEFNAGDARNVRRGTIGENDDIFAYNAEKQGGKISVNVSVQTGNIADKWTLSKYEDGFLFFTGREESGRDYGLVARIIINGGEISKEDGLNGETAAIKNADEITIFVKTFANSYKEEEFNKIKRELSSIKDNYGKVANKNAQNFKKKFDACELKLSGGKTELDVKELCEMTNRGELSTDLIEKMWNFSKYILISAGDKLTPAGLWCADKECSNGTVSFVNIAQILYGGMGKSLFPERIERLLDYFIKYEDDLKKNASRVYGARGYFIPNVVINDGGLFGDLSGRTLHFVASAALAANLFYSYYLVTGDEKILKGKIFPFMKEVLNFYADFLQLSKNGMTYETIPSYSPNSTPGNIIGGKPLSNFNLASSSTIDFLAIKNLLSNMIDAAEILKLSKEKTLLWKDMFSKLSALSVNENGSLREYGNSVFVDRIDNEGVMHGYGLYPLKQFISLDEKISYGRGVMHGMSDDGEILASAASANAVKLRIKSASRFQPTSTLAMAALQLCYAGEISTVYDILMQMIASSITPSGLFVSNDWRGSGLTASNYVNLDIASNVGFATVITDCIIQSDKKTLKILPILFDSISVGEISNILVDFGANISVKWNADLGKVWLKIVPKKDVLIDIVFNEAFKKFKNKKYEWNGRTNSINDIKLKAKQAVTIDVG